MKETENAQMNEQDFAKLTGPAKLEIVRILPATPERVWEYIVDPELRQKWFCAGATGDRPGQEFVMDFDHSRISNSPPPADVECGDPIVMRGTILKYDRPFEFAYSWPEADGKGTIVTIKLAADGENTRLHLVHERLENPEFKKGASAGWHAHLDLLVDVAANAEVRDFWLHYAGLKAEYDQRMGS